MCTLEQLSANGLLLKFMTKEKLCYIHCATAVFSNPKAIKYIPVDLVDDVILEHVIRSGEQYINCIPDGAISPFAEHLIGTLYPHLLKFEGLAESQLLILDEFYTNIGLSHPQRKLYSI